MSITYRNGDTVFFEMTSVCGCGFEMSFDATGPSTITMVSHDSTFARVRDLPDNKSAMDLVDFVQSVALAAEADRDEGTPYANLVVQGVHYPDLGLEAEVKYLGDDCECLRMVFTLLSDDHDSLGYCHLSVTVDVSLDQLVESAGTAYRQLPWGI